jgi:hypothetical protein
MSQATGNTSSKEKEKSGCGCSLDRPAGFGYTGATLFYLLSLVLP